MPWKLCEAVVNIRWSSDYQPTTDKWWWTKCATHTHTQRMVLVVVVAGNGMDSKITQDAQR